MEVRFLKRKFIKVLVGGAAFFIMLAFAFDNRLIKRSYTIESNKLKNDLKIIHISDLHSCLYGDKQCKLIDVIENEKPDIIMLSGDIIDDKMDEEPAFLLLNEIGKKYDCFYSTGNHEIWTNDVKRIKNALTECGITVLAGDKHTMDIKGEKIEIFGIDDPEIGDEEFFSQYIKILQNVDNKNFSVLISHRPELIDLYDAFDGDLILSGHAHGGQWRIPFVLNGFIAPNQGFFPKYTGGLYDCRSAKMIVSRGLSKENTCIPRIFNRPEIVIINIKSS